MSSYTGVSGKAWTLWKVGRCHGRLLQIASVRSAK